MSLREVFALGSYLSPELKGRTISDARHTVSLTDSLQQASLVGRTEELAGRSVLLAVADQLISAVAMTEVDGLARRMLLCPPDLDPDHVRTLIEDGEIEAIVTDQPARWSDVGVYLVAAARLPVRAPARARARRATEWLMLTLGPSGGPKIVSHTLEGHCGAIGADGPAQGTPPVWATFSDIRCDGGLQIFLRAIIGGGSMVLSEPGELIADHAARLAARGVTHISGTPSHWRKLLASGSAGGLSPRCVHVAGEVADQALLDALTQAFPGASILGP
jgi:acyl-CoA synthetase (AMP-forming)/AMP-acid ligase II